MGARIDGIEDVHIDLVVKELVNESPLVHAHVVIIRVHMIVVQVKKKKKVEWVQMFEEL